MSRRVYRLAWSEGTVIVKLFGPESGRAFRREVDGARAVAVSLGPWVPRITADGVLETGHRFVAYDEVVGASLHAAVESAELNRADGLRLLGSVLARFHESTRSAASPASTSTSGEKQDLIVDLAAERATLLTTYREDRLAAALLGLADRTVPRLADRAEVVLCHGDLHLRNVIVAWAGDRLHVQGVVDYESVTFAFPEFDLAKTLVVCSAFTDEDQRAVRAGYRHDIDDALLADLVTFHAIDGWLWAVLVEGRDRRLWASRLEAALDYSG